MAMRVWFRVAIGEDAEARTYTSEMPLMDAIGSMYCYMRTPHGRAKLIEIENEERGFYLSAVRDVDGTWIAG
jgi:hypothetical protein